MRIDSERSAYGGSDWRDWFEAYAVLQGLEIQAHVGPWIRRQRPRFGAAIAPRFEAALALDAAQGTRWSDWRAQAAARLAQRMGPDEAWLIPAAPCFALSRRADAAQRGAFYERALALGAVAGHAGCRRWCFRCRLPRACRLAHPSSRPGAMTNGCSNLPRH